MSPSDIAAEIKRSLKSLTVSIAVLFVLVACLAVGGFLQNRSVVNSVSSEANRATAALCTLRHNINDRIITSQEFLIKHPRGFAGITAATIQTGIDRDKKAYVALANLKC